MADANKTPLEIVIDTSAVMAVLLNEPHRGRLLAVTRDARLLAPASLDAEIGNALVAAVRRKRSDADEAGRAAAAFGMIPVTRLPIDLAASVRLSTALGVYAYDAYAILAASTSGRPLPTLDEKRADAAKRAGVRVVEAES